MVGGGENVKFVSSKDSGFVRGQVWDQIVVVEEGAIVELVGGGEGVTLSLLIVVFFSVSEGENLVSFGVDLFIV